MLESIFAKRLTVLMVESGLNQVELSERTGIPQPAISRYLKKREPKPENLLKLALFFRISPFFLYGMSDEKNMSPGIPNVAALQHLPPSHPPIKKIKIQEFERTAAEIRKVMEGLKAGLKGLDKAIEGFKEE